MKCRLVHLFGVWCLHIAANAVLALPVDALPSLPQPPKPESEQSNFTRVSSLGEDMTILAPVSTAQPVVQVKSRAKIAQAPERALEPVFVPNIVELLCSQNLATLKWQYPNDASIQPKHYRIMFSEQSNDTWSELPYSIQTTEAPVKMLYPNIHYRFVVVAVFQDDRKSQSSVKECQTHEDFPVRNPTIVSAYRNGKEVLVKWQPLKPNERGAKSDIFYHIYLFQKEHDEVRQQLASKTLIEPTTEYVFQNLTIPEHQQLAVFVSSFNKLGGSRESVRLFDVKLEARPQLGPQIVSLRVIDASNVHVSWNSVPLESVNGNFQAYVLKLTSAQAPPVQIMYRQNQSVNLYEIDSLNPNTAYNLTISVKNGLDELGPESAVFSFHTKNDALPEKARFTFMQKCEGDYKGSRLVYKRTAQYCLTDFDPKIQNHFEWCMLPTQEFYGNSSQCFENVENVGRALIEDDNLCQNTNFEENELNKILFVRVLSENGDAKKYSEVQQSITDRWDYICKTTVTTTLPPPPTTMAVVTDAAIIRQMEQNQRNSHDSGEQDIVIIPNNDARDASSDDDSNTTVLVIIIVSGAILCIVLVAAIAYVMRTRSPSHNRGVKHVIEQKEVVALNAPSNDDDDDRRSPYPGN